MFVIVLDGQSLGFNGTTAGTCQNGMIQTNNPVAGGIAYSQSSDAIIFMGGTFQRVGGPRT